MTKKDLSIVGLRSADGVAALLGGRLDALVAANLDKDLSLVSQKVVQVVSFADLLPNFQYTFILFGKSMLEADRKVGVDFLAAYLRGLWDFQAGKDPRAFQKLAEAGHSDVTAVRNACRAGLSRDGRVEIADVQRVVDWAVSEGLCEKSPDMSQLVDNTRVEEANRLAQRGGRG
jgi:ABC-type nitrate/sulfonate/bicarbonate transport system substrate-binding protein